MREYQINPRKKNHVVIDFQIKQNNYLEQRIRLGRKNGVEY